MCYNCGCGVPDDPMGKGHAGVDPEGKSITDETFKEAAKSQGMNEVDAKKAAFSLLSKISDGNKV